MAARRLKFKPKPLVGLIRRNKDSSNDEANASLINKDLIDGNSQSSFNKDESFPISENRTVHGVADGTDKSSKEQINNNEAPCNKSYSTPGSILVKDCINLNNIDNNSSQIIDDRLKSDINNRIKTVISISSSDICDSSKDKIFSSVAQTYDSNEISVTKNFETKGIIETNSYVDIIRPLLQQNDSSVALAVNKSHSNSNVLGDSIILEQSRLSSEKDTNVIQNEKSVICDNSSVAVSNESKLQNTDSDTKHANTASKLPSRFGKTRFKPVLSTVVRKKDAKPGKKEEILPETQINPNSTQEISKPVENHSCFSINEKSVEKENIDKNIGSAVEVALPGETETIVVTEKSLPAVSIEEPAQNIQKDDVITSAETENELSARSPVKLFQPKKRQRSQGNSLSNMTHKAHQDFKDKFKDGNIDKSKLMMRDLIFYNPKTNPMSNKLNVVKSKREPSKIENNSSSIVEDKLDEERVDDVCDDESESSMPVPQVKVGPDGKIILDPRSLVIETTGIQKERANLEKSEIVQENEFSFNKFHKRKVRRSDWSAEETLLFYKALNDLGADFSLMQSLFPKKTRRDLKLKFKKEERINVSLIDKAMRSRGNFDFAALEIELKKDREERERKLEEQRKLKAEKKLERLEKKIPKPAVKRQPKLGSGTRKKSFEVNVIKKNDEKIKRILTFKMHKKDDTDENENEKVQKLRRNRKKTKKHKGSDEEEEECDESQLCFVDVSSSSMNFSSDDGIVSDFLDDDSNEHDDHNDIASLNAQIFTKTRSGRQPRSKLLRGDSLLSDDSPPRPHKKFKKGNTKQTKDVSDYNNSALDTVLTEAVEEFNGDCPVITSEEEIQRLYKEKFERCYQLFEEPLDLSNPNLRSNFDGDDVGDQNNYHASCENDDIVEDLRENNSENDGVDSGFVSSAVSSESDLGDVLGKERNLTESLQIVEELTSSNTSEMDCGVILVPDLVNQYILPGIKSEEYKDNRQTESCTDTSDDNRRIIYSLNDDEIIVNEQSDDQNIHMDNTPIIINNMQSMPSLSSSTCFTVNNGQQIQVISQEQINYILKQNCGAILPDHTDEESSLVSDNRRSDATESISHSNIHCYPSSDHTYTSLTPRGIEPKTLFIVTQMNPGSTGDSHPLSTIVVCPSSNDNVPS